MRVIVSAAVAAALLSLGACGQGGAFGQPNNATAANGAWPQPQQQGWSPQAQGQPAQTPYPAQPGGQIPAPWQAQGAPMGAPQGGSLQISGAPSGMRQLPSAAGYVFTTRLGGTPRASQLMEGLQQGLNGYFDGPIRVMGQQTDPNDRLAQVAFQATLHGQPVMGSLGVMSDGGNGGTGWLLFDSPERVGQSMPVMLQATRGQ